MVPLRVTSPKTIFSHQVEVIALNSQARDKEMEWEQDQGSRSSSVASLISDFQTLVHPLIPSFPKYHEARTVSAASQQALTLDVKWAVKSWS